MVTIMIGHLSKTELEFNISQLKSMRSKLENELEEIKTQIYEMSEELKRR